ncbi:nucleotide-binding alpha-beta plait domain-containing protein [Tanacetum coccineum]
MGDRNRGCFKSKEDQIQQLSKIVYVTNFPNHIRAQDLWNVCKDYGSVVDVYIPFKKSFSKVSYKNSANTAPGSYAFAVKKGPLNSIKENEMKPALVLDDSCYQDRDFSLSLLGKVKEFSSLSNLKMAKENFLSHVGAGSWFSSLQQPSDSFHTDERIAWIDIEGVLIMAWKRVCIKTKMVENIFESFKIIVKGKVYWTRVKEVTGWNPDFMEEDDTQTESDNATIQKSVKAQSEDPFNINDILNKKHENVIVGDRSQTADTLKYPPGFTPNNTTEANSNHDLPLNINSGENTMSQEDVVSNKPNHKPKEDGKVFACSSHFQKATTPRSQGSFLQFMEELVKVGHTMGYKMDGCIKNIEEIIEFQGVNEVNR